MSTPEQRQYAVQMKAHGTPVTTIAKHFKVSVPAVYTWLAESRGGARKSVERRVTELELELAKLRATMVSL